MGFAEDAPERRAIRIMNPINEDLSLMRTTLAPQMIHAMGRNQKRGIFEGRIFEIGNAFIPKSLPLTEYPEERETLCIGAFGKEESLTMKKQRNRSCIRIRPQRSSARARRLVTSVR